MAGMNLFLHIQALWLALVGHREGPARWRRRRTNSTCWTLLLLLGGCAAGGRMDESKLVDLTHAFNEQSVYWPTANRFQLTQVAHGPNAAGEWYASNDFCASEHGGTHLDAPIHFAEGKRATADIPITQFIGPARVIDIRAACAADADYLLAPRTSNATSAPTAGSSRATRC